MKLKNLKSKLENNLYSNIFTITAELFPPKGTDVSDMIKKANIIKDFVTAVNITDCQRAVMRTSSLALSRLMLDIGVEPIYQITTRDRNMLALQSDILGASVLGIKNILVLGGDHPKNGDHKEAIPVYETNTLGLVKTIKKMESGLDFVDKKLKGAPSFFIGTALNPNLRPLESANDELNNKLTSGSNFFQTQPIFDVKDYLEYKNFCDKDSDRNILVGVLLLKSLDFAERMANIPGMNVPKEILNRLEKSNDQLEEGIKISREIIKELKDKNFAKGVHIMAIGTEEYIPKILEYI